MLVLIQTLAQVDARPGLGPDTGAGASPCGSGSDPDESPALVFRSLTEMFLLQETRRNTLIKDSMREQCIPHLVESWFQILQTYQGSQPEITCQCLEVVGAYVSWIDLNLIANDR